VDPAPAVTTKKMKEALLPARISFIVPIAKALFPVLSLNALGAARPLSFN
jgi:hypothetical protein